MIKVEKEKVTFKGDRIELLADAAAILDKLSVELNYDIDKMLSDMGFVINLKWRLEENEKDDVNLS